ncbi:hypothetical protein HS7_00710 [Sulfolobales archaeon HS-7]|nr:hypothetical protein HS7_00710 [Sulfolobales archaeon HS-7]
MKPVEIGKKVVNECEKYVTVLSPKIEDETYKLILTKAYEGCNAFIFSPDRRAITALNLQANKYRWEEEERLANDARKIERNLKIVNYLLYITGILAALGVGLSYYLLAGFLFYIALIAIVASTVAIYIVELREKKNYSWRIAINRKFLEDFIEEVKEDRKKMKRRIYAKEIPDVINDVIIVNEKQGISFSALGLEQRDRITTVLRFQTSEVNMSPVIKSLCGATCLEEFLTVINAKSS